MKHSNNPVYTILADIAREHLAEHGKFFRADVIAASPFAKHPNMPIEWGALREIIEPEIGGKLIPISARDDGEWDPTLHPEKFLPGAHHPTIGYALPADMPRVSMGWLDRRHKVAVGVIRSVDTMAVALQSAGLPIEYKAAVPPVLTLPPREAAE